MLYRSGRWTNELSFLYEDPKIVRTDRESETVSERAQIHRERAPCHTPQLLIRWFYFALTGLTEFSAEGWGENKATKLHCSGI